MSSRIRVFVSSTMKDLANERDAVVRKIAEFNFEPVNAESWLPNGAKSWDRIHQEILSSHLFVLLGGDRYGWIPDSGPGASGGLSVTHMEVQAAQAANLPILPFLKRLDYEADRSSQDAQRRDAFRNEIRSWPTGYFVSEFTLASDLAERIGAALVSVLSESYLNAEVQRRSAAAVPLAEETSEPAGGPLVLDPLLIDLVAKREAVLLAGAGMSMRAGFPSARALTELLVSQVRKHGDDFSSAALSGSLQDVAENFELAYGRESLVEIIHKALSAPQGIDPTPAHHLSVRLFNRILTTNFDQLFELACQQASRDYETIFEDRDVPAGADKVLILKIDGSLSAPGSLVLTARDALGMRQHKPRLWQSLAALVSTSPIVIVGHSLRDLTTKRLFDHRRPEVPGFIVAPDIGSFDERRFNRRGLRVVKADADSFFRGLASAVGR